MFERVAIVGVGLLGASLGMALKARRLAGEIVGVGRAGSNSLEVALGRGAIDQGFTDLNEALATGPALVVLCVPVRQFPEAMRAARERLRGDAIVTDVGSTKGRVMAWGEEIFGAGAASFVGSHPMAGSEKRGPGAARAELFEGGLCLLCEPGNGKGGAATEKVAAMWRAIGMRTMILQPGAHDRWVAAVSHLPHAIAACLMSAAAKRPEMLAAAAGGFTDMTRIAGSDVEMWTDIFMTNREAVAAAIDDFSAGLAAMKVAIRKGDEAGIRAALLRAKEEREAFVAMRTKT